MVSQSGREEIGLNRDELDAVLNAINDGITVQRRDGSLVYANSAAAAMIGFNSVEELLSTPVSEFIQRFQLFDENGEPMSPAELPGRKVLESKQAQEKLVQFRVVESGEEHWSLIRARPIYDKDGNVNEVVNSFQNVTAQQQAFAAERAMRAQAEDARRRLEFLSRTSAILSRSLDYHTTLRRLARLTVPWLADWCGVDLLQEDGSFDRVAVAHVDPAKVDMAYELFRRYAGDSNSSNIINLVVESGQVQLIPTITDEMLVQRARDENHLQLMRRLQLHSLVLVPLKGREGPLGVLTLASAESQRDFDEQDIALAEELARRAAVAVENAHLYSQATRYNEELEERVAQRTQELEEEARRHRLAESRFRALLESAPDAMVIVDEASRITLVNSQTEALFGYQREELLGQEISILIPDLLEVGDDVHTGTVEDGEPEAGTGIDRIARHKDGHRIEVEISSNPLRTAQGLLHITVFRDVSERREAERQLRESQMQLAEAQQIARVGSWSWDVASNKVSWSDEMFRIYGITPEQFDGTYEAFLERVEPEDRAHIDRVVRASFENHQPFSYYERIRWPDGTLRVLHSHGKVETDEEGNVTRLLGTCQDITELKQTEQALRQSEALYRSIAQNIPSGAVFVVDRDMRYRLAEGPILPELGLVGDGVEGKTIYEVLPGDEARARISWYEAALAGQTVSGELGVGNRTFLIQMTPLFDEEGEIYATLALAQDITERKEAEETMRSLLRLSSKLTATLDLDNLMSMLTEEALALTKSRCGTSGLYTPQGFVTHTYHLNGQAIPWRRTFRPGQGIPGWLIEHKEPYLSNDVASDPFAIPEICAQFGLETVLSTPVLDTNGEILAFFEVSNKEDGTGFTESDREKLMGISQIASIAIQNAQSYEQMRELSRKIVHAQEEERRRLSRELHDSAGQVLTALQINLSMLASSLEDKVLQQQVQEAAEMASATHDEIRAASHALRPPALEMVGLNATLQALCRDFAKQAGLEIEYEGIDIDSVPDQISISFYRFVQEALTNVARHAQATSVQVRLAYERDELYITVEDDGIGISDTRLVAAPASGGVGLLGLRERFELIGGEVRVESINGHGTRVAARCPIN
jgi:PAS domain S-box-containing protein